jgi:hypothetical protein
MFTSEPTRRSFVRLNVFVLFVLSRLALVNTLTFPNAQGSVARGLLRGLHIQFPTNNSVFYPHHILQSSSSLATESVRTELSVIIDADLTSNPDAQLASIVSAFHWSWMLSVDDNEYPVAIDSPLNKIHVTLKGTGIHTLTPLLCANDDSRVIAMNKPETLQSCFVGLTTTVYVQPSVAADHENDTNRRQWLHRRHDGLQDHMLHAGPLSDASVGVMAVQTVFYAAPGNRQHVSVHMALPPSFLRLVLNGANDANTEDRNHTWVVCVTLNNHLMGPVPLTHTPENKDEDASSDRANTHRLIASNKCSLMNEPTNFNIALSLNQDDDSSDLDPSDTADTDLVIYFVDPVRNAIILRSEVCFVDSSSVTMQRDDNDDVQTDGHKNSITMSFPIQAMDEECENNSHSNLQLECNVEVSGSVRGPSNLRQEGLRTVILVDYVDLVGEFSPYTPALQITEHLLESGIQNTGMDIVVLQTPTRIMRQLGPTFSQLGSCSRLWPRVPSFVHGKVNCISFVDYIVHNSSGRTGSVESSISRAAANMYFVDGSTLATQFVGASCSPHHHSGIGPLRVCTGMEILLRQLVAGVDTLFDLSSHNWAAATHAQTRALLQTHTDTYAVDRELHEPRSCGCLCIMQRTSERIFHDNWQQASDNAATAPMVISFVNDRRRNIKLPLGFHVDAYLVSTCCRILFCSLRCVNG